MQNLLEMKWLQPVFAFFSLPIQSIGFDTNAPISNPNGMAQSA